MSKCNNTEQNNTWSPVYMHIKETRDLHQITSSKYNVSSA